MANVGVISLGCPKNLTDSEEMMGAMVKAGHQLVNDPEQADVILVNTCAFVGPAEQETRRTMQEFIAWKNQRANRHLLMTGCYTQKHRLRIREEFPDVDGFLGTADTANVGEALSWALARNTYYRVSDPSSGEQRVRDRVLATAAHTAYIKIAEGCNKACSFCIIPQLRGNYRSRSIDDIVAEVTGLVSAGVQEVVLISQESSYYGRDLGLRNGLDTLLERLCALEGLRWIRFFYVYPENMSERLIELVRDQPKICAYFDLPLQHVSTRVLKLMRRASTFESTCSLVQSIRRHIPQATIRANFIVGFPSETEAEFEELKGFLNEFQLERVGIFPYSREEGTGAALLPGQIDEDLKKQRYETLRAQQQSISRARLTQRMNQVLPVLVTHSAGYGRSEFEAPEVDGMIKIKSKKKLRPGQWVKVKITGAGLHDLEGILVP